MPNEDAALYDLFKLLFQAHPWHGVTPGENAPGEIGAYIEIVPTDPVKYELEKTSGHLRVDRPQRFSSMCPTLYGFIPQTFCGEEVAALCAQRTDVAYGHIEDIGGCPIGLVDRLKHYFLSYKQLPGAAPRRVEISDVYGRGEAFDVIERSMRDYRKTFGDPEKRISQLRKLVLDV
ncbi:MAG: inorganic diphosphatase [Acidobacteria bacterium]|nr:inorganic diphosphatase [Acidobacteriota bacterium]